MSKQVRRKYKTQLDIKLNRFRKKSQHDYILNGLFALNSSNQKAIGQVIRILKKDRVYQGRHLKCWKSALVVHRIGLNI